VILAAVALIAAIAAAIGRRAPEAAVALGGAAVLLATARAGPARGCSRSCSRLRRR